jgi:rubrerythrin
VEATLETRVESTFETFDLEKYLNISRRLDVEDIDWADVPNHPLSDEEVRVLQYFIDIETYTIIYLKELLSTPAALDTNITAFLGCWNYEEYFHGHNLERFLKAAGVAARKDNGMVKKDENFLNKIWLLAMTAASKVLDWRFICVHMSWGALNELSTLMAYQQIIEKTRHPILQELCRRIIKDERRHFSFYYNQAKMRLQDNFSRALTRRIMDKYWSVVGSGQKPDEDVNFIARYLFGDESGRRAAEEMDRMMGALPGFEGFDGVRRMLVRTVSPTLSLSLNKA